MSQNKTQTEPPQDAELPTDEPGITTAFDKSGDTEFTADGPEGEHIVPQDEFWDGVKNADQTPRDVASTVPTDVAEPEMTPEEERDQNG